MITLKVKVGQLSLAALFLVSGLSAPAAGLLALEDEDKEEQPEWLAVTGGDVFTGTGSYLRGATVLAKDGKIDSIGYDLFIPEEAERLDAGGMRVYPGLVAISSSGLLGGSGDLADTIDPFSSRMVLGLAAGITTTSQSNQVAKLKRGELEGAVLSEKAFSGLTWSGAGGKRALKEKFETTATYLRAYREWEELVKKDKELKEPSKRGVDSTVLAVLEGRILAKFSANGRDDLLGIARLAQKYGFRPVIEGCGEGWAVADELGRAGAMAIVTPRYRRSKEESLVRDGGSSIENAAILHRAGVSVAVIPSSKSVNLGGIAGRDIMHLIIEAGFAVRGGLPEKSAIDAITIQPARMLGVGHRVGSLEVGKDCDLIVTDGDLLHYETFVQYAVVDGKLVYDKQEELWFSHIRPRPEAPAPEESPVDAGERPEDIEDDGEAGDDDESGDEDEEDGDEGDEDEEGDD
ncbi:MAG: amidohydrolase family protein [Planctomycetota bacterium]|nr:amidohydrolase family protein [Planctomycetota bacterium]